MSHDIFLSRTPADNELISAIAAMFGVAESDVLIEHQHPTLENVEGRRVVCGVEAAGGDFPCWLSLIPLEKALLPAKYFPVIGALCQRLNCCAMDATGDETSNPYLWTYICGVDDYQLVRVNAERLDQEDNPELEIVEYLRKIDPA